MSLLKKKSFFYSLWTSIECDVPNSNTRSGRRELIRLAKVLRELEQHKVVNDYSVPDVDETKVAPESSGLLGPH